MPEFYEPAVLKRLQETELSILRDFVDICESHGLEYYGIAGTGIGAIRHGGFIPWDDDIDIAMPRDSFEKMIAIVERDYQDKYYIVNAWRDRRYPLMTTRLAKKGTLFVENALKDAHCPCGIFLDLYVLDNVADNGFLYQWQSWEAWFVSKLLILRCIPKPYLAARGVKARLILAVCGVVHGVLKGLRVSPAWLRDRCHRICRRYDGKKTRRMAFLPDTSPYWNVIDREKLHPLKHMDFEGISLAFPGNIEEMLTNMYGDFMKLPPKDKRKTHFPYRLSFDRGPGVGGANEKKSR